MSLQIEIVDDPARVATAMMISAAAAGGDIVLAGGSTPREAYKQFVDVVKSVSLSLSHARWWIGDERSVPPDDERSNYRMIKETLLDPLGDAAPPNVHRIQGELGPEDAAAAYERELLAAGPPHFELLLLGMGPDGHTASMFPDQDSLSERSRLVVGVPEAGLEPFVPRVTFTLPALALAHRVVFLVAGENKAEAVAAAFGPNATPDPHVPSSMAVQAAREVTVLLDRAAARRL